MKIRTATIIGMCAIWWMLSRLCGSAVFPGPWETIHELFRLCGTSSVWRHVCLTVFRGASGLVLGLTLGLFAGIPCGLSNRAMALLDPVLAVMQSCPPIIWITFLLVWIGSGSAVPILVVCAAVFPALFLTIAQGTRRLDRRLLQMAVVYRLPIRRRIVHILMPGILQHAISAITYAAGTTWKVTATAEFFGSEDGVGARIYWAYRMLDMTALFAWALIIILVGVALDIGVVQWLRSKVNVDDQ